MTPSDSKPARGAAPGQVRGEAARAPAAPLAGDITRLLARWRQGEAAAAAALGPLVFDELHRIAERQFRGEPAGHTLQPTAVLSEAWLKLLEQRVDWRDRDHFFALAAQAMRRILVDHARRRRAAKRELPAVLEEPAGGGEVVDLLALDAALTGLAALDAAQAQVVELKYFAGLTNEEAAQVLGVSLATVKRAWLAARAYLHRSLSDGPR